MHREYINKIDINKDFRLYSFMERLVSRGIYDKLDNGSYEITLAGKVESDNEDFIHGKIRFYYDRGDY